MTFKGYANAEIGAKTLVEAKKKVAKLRKEPRKFINIRVTKNSEREIKLHGERYTIKYLIVK